MDDLEEFKKQLKEDPEKARRFAEESNRLANEVEIRLRDRQSPSLDEMRDYVDKVKKEFEEQRRYDRLPWWKRLFKERPSFG